MKRMRSGAVALAVAAVMLCSQAFAYAEQNVAPPAEQEQGFVGRQYSDDPEKNDAINAIFDDYAAKYLGTPLYALMYGQLEESLAEYGIGVHIEYYSSLEDMPEHVAAFVNVNLNDNLPIFDPVLYSSDPADHVYDPQNIAAYVEHSWGSNNGAGYCKQVKYTFVFRCLSCPGLRIDIHYTPGCGAFHGI